MALRMLERHMALPSQTSFGSSVTPVRCRGIELGYGH
jgi:hypothetical protein